MKVLIIAGILSISTVGTLSAAESGGFGYVSVGSGQCQVLVDARSGTPVLETSKRAPSKVILIGAKGECPGEYNGYKVNRMASGFVSGFIFNAAQDSGRKVYIFRKMGSNFMFRYASVPKK